jgi:outer membrane protein assembly factor BamB
MTRTVPAVTDRFVVTLGPKCHVVCLDALTGKLVWEKNLVEECGTTVPPWYAGQCPLIDGDRVILAPGAKPLMMAVALASGKTLWATRDHDAMGMTHSSIVAMNFQGQKQYLYCAKDGVAGVAAADGRVLWTYPQWKINIANVPSPIPVGEDRIFFSGGYESGCAMVRLVAQAGAITPRELFRLKLRRHPRRDDGLPGPGRQAALDQRRRAFRAGTVPAGQWPDAGLER